MIRTADAKRWGSRGPTLSRRALVAALVEIGRRQRDGSWTAEAPSVAAHGHDNRGCNMDTMSRVRALVLVVGMTVALALTAQTARAHCDTLGGPVVAAAKTALEKGDITPVLKWVQKDDEPVIRDAFQKTLVVRAKGPEAKALADMYFFETLVRVHRAGEGAPYTGLKPADAVEPIVAACDEALDSGKIEEVVEHVMGAVATGIRDRFERAAEARKHADENVAAGREFVEAYVGFMHYVEGVHQAAMSAAAHHGEAEDHHARSGHQE